MNYLFTQMHRILIKIQCLNLIIKNTVEHLWLFFIVYQKYMFVREAAKKLFFSGPATKAYSPQNPWILVVFGFFFLLQKKGRKKGGFS